MDKEHDCFNGQSTVGPKYTRLDIDFKLVNERDFPEPEDEYENQRHAMDWDWVDDDGEDIFDRMGFMVFGGPGWVASFARNIVLPSMSTSRKIYRRHLSDYIYLILAAIVLPFSYYLFIYRKIHKTCCQEPLDSDEELEEEQEKELTENQKMRRMQEQFWRDVAAEQE